MQAGLCSGNPLEQNLLVLELHLGKGAVVRGRVLALKWGIAWRGAGMQERLLEASGLRF